MFLLIFTFPALLTLALEISFPSMSILTNSSLWILERSIINFLVLETVKSANLIGVVLNMVEIARPGGYYYYYHYYGKKYGHYGEKKDEKDKREEKVFS